MADVFDFYVYDDRSIRFTLAEPIMLEDKDVTQFRFRIPKSLNGFDMRDWEWWFIFVNPKGTKNAILLELTDDEDEPEEYSIATYTLGHEFTDTIGTVKFAIEVLNMQDNEIVNEWHTRTYSTAVIDTLQGEGGGVVRHLIVYDLTNVNSSNMERRIEDGSPYISRLTPYDGLIVDNVIVMMGGIDITDASYNDGVIEIAAVTNDVSITASAAKYVDNITINDVDSSLRTKTLSTVEAINNAPTTSVSFVLLTDTHGDANGQKSQNAVRYILKSSKANKLFWLGDMSETNWSLSEYTTFSEPLLNCADKVYVTLGNHEYFGGNATDIQGIYEDFLEEKTNLNGLPTSFYYYFDDTTHKVRYIVINTSEGVTNLVSSAQIAWLNDAVQLPDATWGIIAFAHFPVKRQTESAETVSNQRYEIRDALLSTNGTVISYICGHTHADVNSVIDYSFYQQIFLNDSVSGQAVNVVNINLASGLVHVYRIGNGSDIEYTYTELPALVTRTIANTLTGCTNTNSSTSIIDGRPYSATLIAEANYDIDSGTVVITMGGTDVTSTVYDSSTHSITIDAVTGDVEITAIAEYVAPIEEYSASWLIRDTANSYPNYTFSSVADAVNNFPNYLSFIMCNQTTPFPTGFRGSSSQTYAKYQSRTSGWTSHDYEWKSDLRTSTGIVTVTVNSKYYAYVTFTKAESDAAYALYEAAIAGGEIANGGGIKLISGKTLDANFEFWVLDQNVDASNIESVIKRLPAHSS